jgi:hypothetical protein
MMEIHRRGENQHIGLQDFLAEPFPCIPAYRTPSQKVAAETTAAELHVQIMGKNLFYMPGNLLGPLKKMMEQMGGVSLLSGTTVKGQYLLHRICGWIFCE